MTRGRIALLGALAIIVVLLGVLVVVLDDGDEDVSTDATTTTTDATTTSSSTASTTVPVSTTAGPSTTVPAATTSTTLPRRVLLAEGDGWTATRTTSGGEHCVELTSAAAAPVTGCGITPAAAVLGDVLSVAVPGGLLVVATSTFSGGVEVWTNSGGARPIGFIQPVAADDALGPLLLGVVEASERIHLVLRDPSGVLGAAGDVPTGGHVPATDLGLRTGHPFTALDGYQVFMDSAQGGFRSMDAGRYVDGDGRDCVLVRELLPEPRAVLDRCDVEPPTLLGEAILLPTDVQGRFDFVGLAAPEVASWACELPEGTDCDLGGVAAGNLPYRLLLHTGPIGVDGTDPDHLVIVLFDANGAELGRADVPTP